MTLLRPQSKSWETRAANSCLAWETDLRIAADALVEAQMAYVRGDVEEARRFVAGAGFFVRVPMTVMGRELRKEDLVDKHRAIRAEKGTEQSHLMVLGRTFRTKKHRGKLVELTRVVFQSYLSGRVYEADIWEHGKVTGTTTVPVKWFRTPKAEVIKEHFGGKLLPKKRVRR